MQALQVSLRTQERKALVALAGIAGVFAVAITTLGSGADGGGGDVLREDLPVIRSAAGAPGTLLGDGFRVAAGTTLVGAPTPLHPEIGVGWTATLLIDADDVMPVLTDYVNQAKQSGLALRTGPECRQVSEVTFCSASARKEDDEGRRTFVATTYRGREGDLALNHAVVRVSDGDLDWEYTPEGIDGEVVEPGPFDREWPPLADVGEPIGTGDMMCLNVVVQEGSRLAAPTRIRGDHTRGIVAILEVTGEPNRVLERYLQHFADSECSIEVGETTSHKDGDATVTIAFASSAGGDGFTLTVLERPGQAAWLTIDGSHD